MSKKKIQPRLVFADNKGNIYDHPDLLMLAQKGTELVLPRPDELIPLPQGSDPPTGLVEADGKGLIGSGVTVVLARPPLGVLGAYGYTCGTRVDVGVEQTSALRCTTEKSHHN